MSLPIHRPFAPMEARSAREIPAGPEWTYEPKWDGFRCLAFRDGEKVELQSKAGKPLTRYFPELVQALGSVKAKRFVLDGEIVILEKNKLAFDQLLQRIHPAASRIARLSIDHPARFVVFDILADEKGESFVDTAFDKRRTRLESFFRQYLAKNESFLLSRHTSNLKAAERWLAHMRGQLDGIVAKRMDLPYMSGERAMEKIKNIRTADCVVGGFRYASAGKVVGSLLLGLYRGRVLDHVGFTSSFPTSERLALAKKLEKLIEPPGFTGAAPGGPSRWNTDRSSEWEPLRPELVVEVEFDHFSGGRFRHGTKFLRWRPDKAPRQCTMKQVEADSAVPLKLLTQSGI